MYVNKRMPTLERWATTQCLQSRYTLQKPQFSLDCRLLEILSLASLQKAAVERPWGQRETQLDGDDELRSHHDGATAHGTWITGLCECHVSWKRHFTFRWHRLASQVSWPVWAWLRFSGDTWSQSIKEQISWVEELKEYIKGEISATD